MIKSVKLSLLLLSLSSVVVFSSEEPHRKLDEEKGSAKLVEHIVGQCDSLIENIKQQRNIVASGNKFAIATYIIGFNHEGARAMRSRVNVQVERGCNRIDLGAPLPRPRSLTQ